LPDRFRGKDELKPCIGTIIRKHFPKDASPHNLSKGFASRAASA
jgi:hypothetical protein